MCSMASTRRTFFIHFLEGPKQKGWSDVLGMLKNFFHKREFCKNEMVKISKSPEAISEIKVTEFLPPESDAEELCKILKERIKGSKFLYFPSTETEHAK